MGAVGRDKRNILRDRRGGNPAVVEPEWLTARVAIELECDVRVEDVLIQRDDEKAMERVLDRRHFGRPEADLAVAEPDLSERERRDGEDGRG